MKDYKKGEQVVHCRDGLAVIIDRIFMGDKEYYLAKTIRGEGENVYVPVEKAEVIIRPLLTINEADALLEEAKSFGIEFNSNTKQRRDALKRRLSSGNVEDIMFLYKQLDFYKNHNDGSIKYGPVDLDMLNFAAKNLLDELSIVYKIDRDKIDEFVAKKVF